MARIYKRTNVWYIDIRVKGQRVRRRVGSSKRIAELALKDAEVKIARDEFGFTHNDIAVEKLLEKYLDYSRINHAPSTTVRFSSVIENLREFLRQKYPRVTHLSQLTPEIIERYKMHRRDAMVNPNGRRIESDEDITEHTRKGVRSRTVNFELKVLTNIFNVAINWGYIKENPTKKVKRLKVTDGSPVRFLTEKECQKLLVACPDDLYLIYFTFLNTGMRKSELENLEWSDIDFKRRKISIQRKEFWQPKSKDREIPLSNQLYKLMKQHRESNRRGLNSSFVFPHRDGGKIKIKLRDKLIEITHRVGIENVSKIHTLRHTFASHLVMSGVDLPTVMKLMGHSDIQTTMIYAHLAPDHLADAVNKLSF